MRGGSQFGKTVSCNPDGELESSRVWHKLE